jgi:putative ABC transport system permease protein
MFRYYLALALRSLSQNVALTALMIIAVGIGIGASITTLTIFRAMSGDPIPQRAGQLFVPQIDNFGPAAHAGTSDGLPDRLSYTDALALMRAHPASRQAAMYATGVLVTPVDPQQLPFEVPARATYVDFFSMFDVPFQFGRPWTAADDEARIPRVVISQALNAKLFGGANSVGKAVRLNGHDYVVTGVLDQWQPEPRFYDLSDRAFNGAEQVFVPFTVAVQQELGGGNENCPGYKAISPGKDAILRSECVWINFWAELPTAGSVRRYETFLHNYAEQQHAGGRFGWQARTALRDVTQWLIYEQVVPTEVRILVAVAFSFLFVCMLNAMGLMLAKFTARSATVAVRRALGAHRGAIFRQCLVETGLIGIVGGVLGVGLTALGLLGSRSLLPGGYLILTQLKGADVLIAVALAFVATLLASMYPTWRAAQVQPGWLLKAQ